SYRKEDGWTNFPKGMIQYKRMNGHDVNSGLDILYYGNIPNSAGLSSSASIEMVTGVLLENMFQLSIPRVDMVRNGQQGENELMGVQSGIIDQFAIGMGKKDKAILLECESLDYRYASLELDKHAIIIMNTNKSRTLGSTRYNERRSKCEQALADLKTELPVTTLGELSAEQFDAHQSLIRDPVNRKRAKHAVYENERTIKAHTLLEQGDLE